MAAVTSRENTLFAQTGTPFYLLAYGSETIRPHEIGQVGRIKETRKPCVFSSFSYFQLLFRIWKANASQKLGAVSCRDDSGLRPEYSQSSPFLLFFPILLLTECLRFPLHQGAE